MRQVNNDLWPTGHGWTRTPCTPSDGGLEWIKVTSHWRGHIVGVACQIGSAANTPATEGAVRVPRVDHHRLSMQLLVHREDVLPISCQLARTFETQEQRSVAAIVPMLTIMLIVLVRTGVLTHEFDSLDHVLAMHDKPRDNLCAHPPLIEHIMWAFVFAMVTDRAC